MNPTYRNGSIIRAGGSCDGALLVDIPHDVQRGAQCCQDELRDRHPAVGPLVRGGRQRLVRDLIPTIITSSY